MPVLIAPTVEAHASFIAAMAEFHAEGRGGPDDNSMIGNDLREYGERWADPAVFAQYVRRLNADLLEDSPRPERFVPSTNLWWADGTEYLGRIQIRHRLTDWLRESGGHIGYDIRASARRRGHATRMLHEALPYAAKLGIDPALITCDTGNIASRKVIEKSGGILEDQRGDKLRFWVCTTKE